MGTKSWALTTPADDALNYTIPNLVRDAKKHAQVAAGFYAEAQDTPDQTIAIYAGVCYFGTTKVEYDGNDCVDLGTGGAYEVSALTADYYNKVLFTVNSSGTLEAAEGTEAATSGGVVEPSIPAGKFPVCMVTVQDDGTGTAGTILTIEQSEITQLQGYGQCLPDDTAYAASWNGDKRAPTKDAVYDKVETLMAKTGSNLAIGSDADGDMYYRASSVLARLAKGSANHKLFMNAGATAPEWASGMKIGSFTRDASLASGTQSISGVGFKPSLIIFLGAISGTSKMCIGWDDGSSTHCLTDYNAVSAGTWSYASSLSIYLIFDSSTSLDGKISSLDTDGFTLNWNKVGSPTGTAQLFFAALR